MTKSLWAGAVSFVLLAGCNAGEKPDPCTGESCSNTKLELVVDGDDLRACTVLLSTPREVSWTSARDVRAALERHGRRAAISAVQSSGGGLPTILGEISVGEKEADAVHVVRVECFDGSGIAIESAVASLRRLTP